MKRIAKINKLTAPLSDELSVNQTFCSFMFLCGLVFKYENTVDDSSEYGTLEFKFNGFYSRKKFFKTK